MAIATNQEITNAQIAACLSIVNVAGNIRAMFEDDNVPTPAGDHVTSLEATIITACNRLDTILGDAARWAIPTVDGHSFVAAIAQEQVTAAALANSLKQHEVFAAEFQKQLAISRLMYPPEQSPAQPKNKNAKRKK